MATRWLGLAAAVAAANAFLVTPGMAAASVPAADSKQPDMSTWTWVDPNTQLLTVPCRGCRVEGSADDSNLLLNLTVGNKPGAIELGGEVILPINPKWALHPNPHVLEVPSDASLADIRSNLDKYTGNEKLLTSYQLGFSQEKISDAGDKIIAVDIHISAIGRQHVSVPKVTFKILKNPEGHMMILSSDVAELKPAMPGQPDECDTPLCRWRKFVEGKLHGIAAAVPKLRGCMRGKGHHRRPAFNMHHGPNSHHGGAHGQPAHQPGFYHGGHRQPGHHSKAHNFMHRFARLFVAVIVPVLVGIAAGIATYVVGMIIGGSIAYLWLTFCRGGRRGRYQNVATDESEALVKEEDASRESFESAPPTYEEAPAYEEKEVSA